MAAPESPPPPRPGHHWSPARRLHIRIATAQYGPCEGGAAAPELATRSRDVAPFLRALLLRRQRTELEGEEPEDGAVDREPQPSRNGDTQESGNDDRDTGLVSLSALAPSGMRRREVVLLERASMNVVFGDPCPGTSKRLVVRYTMAESEAPSAVERVHHLTFAEHERIVLRRFDEPDDVQAERLKVSERNDAASSSREIESECFQRPNVIDFELLLPLILSYMTIRERIMFQFVCKEWRSLIQQWGVASSIDSSDPLFLDRNRTILRGILNNSFNSLQCLFLNDFVTLQKEDLHPAIPHLTKLRHMDISRCCHLDDTTLGLLHHLSETLQVLYIKGLSSVTDAGLAAVTRSCPNLLALDISCIHQLTDVSGVEIGRSLPKLRALYLRDNYRLTSQSIDVITSNCGELDELTLWGCIKIKRLSFQRDVGSLRILNLWGCHELGDEATEALENMSQLRTLIVAECHKLTDKFVITACLHVPQLHHLNLRFCRLISDDAVNCIARTMPDLYSLELSFCPKLTAAAIVSLLEARGGTLAELRLQECPQLDFLTRRRSAGVPEDGLVTAGAAVVRALRVHGATGGCLSVLDLRLGINSAADTRVDEEEVGLAEVSFALELGRLGFQQSAPGHFCRQAVWNSTVSKRIVDQALP